VKALFIYRSSLNASPANTHDIHAEAYMTDGQKELAIRNYERPIDLDPKNADGVEVLKKLRPDQKK
jgi:Tfp pilus assembly protein PilF